MPNLESLPTDEREALNKARNESTDDIGRYNGGGPEAYNGADEGFEAGWFACREWMQANGWTHA